MRGVILVIVLIIFGSFSGKTQKVGLVLSGGGADALAHVGVIKALEENNIPIDYITGTSMGALVGALYASGIPISDIERFFTSPEFAHLSDGGVPSEFFYNFPFEKPVPTIIPIRFKKATSGYNLLLPSKIIPSETMDFGILKLLAQAEKEAGYNFDSLLIPFRCVAADVVTKELVTFKNGSLTQAVRASMSYPLFIKPIEIDGHLMYDGGVYNNFPADIMCSEFSPDYIIGSNVSENQPNPSADDLFEQLRSILVKPTDYSVNCVDGELIEPNINFGTFNFENAQAAIDSGYVAAIRQIGHIKHHVERKADVCPSTHRNPDAMIIGEIIFEGIDVKQSRYAGSVLRRKKKKNETLDLKTFQRNYFRLYQESYIEDLYPHLTYNPSTKKYDATVRVTPIKSITLDLGGNVATRPISEGYAGLTYNNLSTFGFKVGISTYYGKLYQALNLFTRIDFATKHPIYVKPHFVAHNWNWFESRQSNLFVTNKPDYIIEGEFYSGIEMGVGLGNTFTLVGNVSYLQQESSYYQTKDFTPSDTSDATELNALLTKLTLSRNRLNQKQYAYIGNSIELQASYTGGNEFYTPGTTSNDSLKSTTEQSFIQVKLDFQNYFDLTPKFKFGIRITGNYSNMKFFNNYTSTIIQSASFKPTPDSKTLFLESFHAKSYGALGVQFVFLPLKKIQIRAEAYLFQPHQSYYQGDNNEINLGKPFANRYTITSAVLAYQTPLGPLSMSLNYYYNNPDISLENKEPLTFLLNFGYTLFNPRGYH